MSATTHPVAPEEVMAFLDGELSPERAEAVSKHIDECADCLKARDSFRGTSQSLAGWMVGTLPEGTGEHALGNMVNVKSPHQFLSGVRMFLSRRSVLVWGGAVFVALLLFIGLDFASYHASYQRVAKHSAPVDAAASLRELDISPYQAKLPAGSPSGGGGGDILSGHRAALAPLAPRTGLTLLLAEKGKNSIMAQGKDAAKTLENEPMIARTVSLTVFVKDFDAGRASLDAILARHNGYAANLSASTPQGAARMIEASLRIPAPQLAVALSELKALGRVEGENQSGEEVTQQHADLVARVKNDRETEVRLQDILEKRTGKVKDVLEVEQEIARVRGEIEQMEAEQKTLEHRVEFATIDLKLSEEYKAQLNPPAPSVWMVLRNATINGFRNAFDTLLGIVLFFAESGPTLVVWLTILGFPAWLVWRRYRRMHALSLGA